MGEVHDVHQAEDEREADGDETVEQSHEEAARQALDDGFGGHRDTPIARRPCLVRIAHGRRDP
jgi:hypothetical protein